MAALDVKCNECGSPSIPKRVEIIANPKVPSQIIDLILTIDCPQCGERKQPAPMDPKPFDPRD